MLKILKFLKFRSLTSGFASLLRRSPGFFWVVFGLAYNLQPLCLLVETASEKRT